MTVGSPPRIVPSATKLGLGGDAGCGRRAHVRALRGRWRHRHGPAAGRAVRARPAPGRGDEPARDRPHRRLVGGRLRGQRERRRPRGADPADQRHRRRAGRRLAAATNPDPAAAARVRCREHPHRHAAPLRGQPRRRRRHHRRRRRRPARPRRPRGRGAGRAARGGRRDHHGARAGDPHRSRRQRRPGHESAGDHRHRPHRDLQQPAQPPGGGQDRAHRRDRRSAGRLRRAPPSASGCRIGSPWRCSPCCWCGPACDPSAPSGPAGAGAIHGPSSAGSATVGSGGTEAG